MALVGNIRDFGLSDFLYLVDRGYKTGCLHLTHGSEGAELYFDKGKLVAAWRRHDAATLLEWLQQKGKLGGTYAQQLGAAVRDGANASMVAVELGIINNTELQSGLQQQIEEAVYSLFAWPEGEFRFEQNQRPAAGAPVLLQPIKVENLIMEGVRRIDEWGRIKDRIPSTDLVVKFVDQPGEKAKGVNLAPEEWRVFARINGINTLAEIAQKTSMSDFDVCRIVYGFLTAGLVEVQRRARPPAERLAYDAPRLKRSLVNRIINRIRGM